jgi:hypothetical protein
MKSLPLILLSVFAILAAGLYPFLVASAEDKTCIFKADAGKVYLTVWDQDSDQDRQDKIFEGWLESEKRQKVSSKTGFIVFSYQLADDDRSYGDNNRKCESGNIIRVP